MKIMTKEAMDALVEDIHNSKGESVRQVAERHGLTRDQVYGRLRLSGIKLSPPGKCRTRTHKVPKVHCLLCGDWLTPKVGKGLPTHGAWKYHSFCNRWCYTMADIIGLKVRRPRPPNAVKIAPPKYVWKPQQAPLSGSPWPYRFIDEELFEAQKQALSQGVKTLECAFVTTRSQRGEQTPPSSIWGQYCKHTIALWYVNEDKPEVAFTITVNPGQTVRQAFVEQFFGGDEEYAKGFDLLVAWRCTCPQATGYVYKSLDDLPEEAGVHGACPLCGAAVFEVIK